MMADEPKKKNLGGRPKNLNGGRPKIHVDLKELEPLAKAGLTDTEMAKAVNVSRDKIATMKKTDPLFADTLKNWKDEADEKVEASLYKRACGYEYNTFKVFQFQGEAVIVPFVEKVAPDPTSMIFWLKNRQSKKWRDKQEIEVTGNLAGILKAARERTDTQA